MTSRFYFMIIIILDITFSMQAFSNYTFLYVSKTREVYLSALFNWTDRKASFINAIVLFIHLNYS